MGVKDLWQVLAPVCERKSLWELEGKIVAVDLSAWVCDSQNVGEYSSQPNMHLRNIFFRTSCLLLLGARPVFVLDGVAPDLKLDTLAHRQNARGRSAGLTKTSGKRRHLKSIQKQCQEMLRYMGVHCVESMGEAEALCALLNETGFVDGCITQDSDYLLYGGKVVYRNFTISSSGSGPGRPNFSVDMYKMDQIEKVLGLTRRKLIGFSLLSGCDYNQSGVSGIGKENALKFLSSLEDGEVFLRFQNWRNDKKFDYLEKERTLGLCDRCGHFGKQRQHDKSGCDACGTTKRCTENELKKAVCPKDPEEQKKLVTELSIRKKALQDPNFPSQEIINEYLCSKEIVPKHFNCEWFQPSLIEFIAFAKRKLNWDEIYSLEKFLPVLTRWVLLWHCRGTSECPVYPKKIIKKRILKGIPSYEVEWDDTAGLFASLKSEGDSDILSVTIEPQELFRKAFLKLTETFEDSELAKKKVKPKGKKKSTKKIPACPECGKEMLEQNQKCLCSFLKKPLLPRNIEDKSLEEMLDDLILHKNPKEEQKESKRNDKSVPAPHKTDKGECSSAASCETKFSFEDFLGEKCSASDLIHVKDLNLSEIVESIVGQSTQESKLFYGKNDSEDNCVDFSALYSENRECSNPCPENTLGQCQPKTSSEILDLNSSLSDDECPYTPLMDRIRCLRERTDQHQSNILASPQAKRFRESFDSLCSDVKVGEDFVSPAITGSRVNFSLGISDFLETSLSE